MKKFVRKYIKTQDIVFIVIVFFLGSLNHFLYDWLGNSAFIALFCPVNESAWEHLKLLYFPFLFVSIGIYLIRRPAVLRFFYYRFLAVLGGMASIIILFYTYTGVIGTHWLPMDLLIYFSGVLLSFYLPYHFQGKKLPVPAQNVIFSLWIIVALCFFAFTCFPPDLGLFFPPA